MLRFSHSSSPYSVLAVLVACSFPLAIRLLLKCGWGICTGVFSTSKTGIYIQRWAHLYPSGRFADGDPEAGINPVCYGQCAPLWEAEKGDYFFFIEKIRGFFTVCMHMYVCPCMCELVCACAYLRGIRCYCFQ